MHQNPLNTSSPPQQSTMNNDDATSWVWKKIEIFFSTFVSHGLPIVLDFGANSRTYNDGKIV